MGFAAAELEPLHARLVEIFKGSSKLFADETTCPVLDPGRGRTKTGYLWTIARDDRSWGGRDQPAVAYLYSPGRGGKYAVRHLAGYNGILQVDGYVGYDALIDANRTGGSVMLAIAGAISAAASTRLQPKATPPSQPRRWSALARSTRSRLTTADVWPTSDGSNASLAGSR